MQNSVAKKIFAVGVAAVTALGSALPFVALAATHAVGTNVKTSDGTIWMIMSNNCRRAYTSGGAFLSYGFNSFSTVVDANADDLALPVCAEGFIPPQDGKLITSDRGADKGTTYLITGGKKAGFTSASVFTGLGFSFARGTVGDVSFMMSDANIDNTTSAHRPGVLVSMPINGNSTVVLMGSNGYLGIPDLNTFNSWGFSFKDVVASNASDRAMSQTGVMGARTAGMLSPSTMGSTTPTPTPGTPTPTPSVGGLTVSVASDTPAARTIADATAFNQVLKLNLTASSQAAVNLTGLKVTRGGFFSNTNINSIGIYDWNNKRHGNEVTTLGSDGVATLTFGSDPIVVPAGQSVWVMVKISIANVSSASGTVSFSVAQASDVISTAASVTGNFPATGNLMTIVEGSSNVATVTLDEQPVNASGVTYNVDTVSAQEISKFRVQETSSNEDVMLYSLQLWNNGTAADNDVMDVALLDQADTVVATAQQVNKEVMFKLNTPYLITKGQTKDFKVRAKIVNGAARTIQFTVYNNYDIDVRGVISGASVLPSAGSNDTTFPIGDSTSTYNKVTIGSGSIIFNRSSDSPTSSMVPGANDQVLASYDIKAVGEDMELRGLSFGIATGTSGTGNMTGTVYVKLDNNIIFSAAYNSTNFPYVGTASSRTLSSYPVLKAGTQSKLTVVGSVSSSATANDAFTVKSLDVTSVKRLITNDITDPSVSPLDGNQRAVNAAALTVTTLATPVAASVIAVTTGVPVANIELNAQASGEDVRVSSIILSDWMGGSGTTSQFVNFLAKDSQGNVLTTSSSTNTMSGTSGATGTVTFNFNTPILVSKTSPVTVSFFGDLVTGTSGTHTFRVVTSGVTATGKDTGNSISSPTYSGGGQTMTLVSGGTLTGSLVTGTGGTPSVAQVVQVGTNDGTYLAFKLNAQYESQKITTLILTATGTQLNQNTLRNIRLYRKVGDSGTMETSPFATAAQFASCSSNSCTYTWTSTDNILPAAIQPGTPVTIYVKADIGGTGVAYVGDDFAMSINMTSGASITARGVTTGSAPTYSGGFLNVRTASNSTFVVPTAVVLTGVTPTEGSTNLSSVGSGTNIGRFKIQNNGSSKVTVTYASFSDAGSNSTTADRYTMAVTAQGSSAGADVTATSSATSVGFGTLTNTFTLDGGAFRFIDLTITAGTGGLSSGDSFRLSVANLGDVKFSVAESDLGYDANQDGDLSDTITSLYADGKPVLGTIQKQ